jgi:hypothetical protein
MNALTVEITDLEEELLQLANEENKREEEERWSKF